MIGRWGSKEKRRMARWDFCVSMDDLSGLSNTRPEVYQRQGLTEGSRKDIKLPQGYKV
jgi:phage gp37-like protein